MSETLIDLIHQLHMSWSWIMEARGRKGGSKGRDRRCAGGARKAEGTERDAAAMRKWKAEKN